MEMEPMEAAGVASGYGLNVAERAGLELAMLQVKLAEKLEKLSFWGRIFGDTADYLVAVATDSSSSFPTKKFYYATTHSPEMLSQMPVLSEAFQQKAATATRTPFTGDPSTPLAEEEPPADGEQPEVFREEHRLAYHVKYLIDADASVVPCGALVVDASRNVVPNAHYQGLTFEKAGFLTSYFHFRSPTSPHAQKALANVLVRPADFLDPLSADTPAGAWSLHFDASKRIAFLRSLYYPGALFFHLINSPSYGNLYVGDGLPNTDLPFML